MTMIDPTPVIKGQRPVPVWLIGLIAVTAIGLMASPIVWFLQDNAPTSVVATAQYTCSSDREVTVPMNPSEKERRQAEIVATSTYNATAQAVTRITVTLRTSDDGHHYNVVAGQLLVHDSVLGAFRLNRPSNLFTLDPSTIDPPPNAELRLCLQRP